MGFQTALYTPDKAVAGQVHNGELCGTVSAVVPSGTFTPGTFVGRTGGTTINGMDNTSGTGSATKGGGFVIDNTEHSSVTYSGPGCIPVLTSGYIWAKVTTGEANIAQGDDVYITTADGTVRNDANSGAAVQLANAKFESAKDASTGLALIRLI